MDSLIREHFFSRQGKATKNAFNSFRSFVPREAPLKYSEKTQINPSEILEEVVKEKHQKKLNQKKAKNSSFFVSMGRDFSLIESDSPGAGHYSPSYDWVDGKVGQGPKYSKPSKKTKVVKVFLPNCINNEFQCKTRNSDPLGLVDKRINKTVMSLDEYETKKLNFRNFTPIPDKPTYKIISPIKLNLQKTRDPFVKDQSGPNPHRFDYHPSKEHILTRFKRPESVDFGKLTGRKQEEIRHSPNPYDKNQEFVMPKLVKLVPIFEKQLERKPNLNTHMLRTPDSPDLAKMTQAYTKLSNVRGTTNIPLMSTQTARDDSMYKVTEAYSLSTYRSS